jgi:hypothetical protein
VVKNDPGIHNRNKKASGHSQKTYTARPANKSGLNDEILALEAFKELLG